MSFYSQIKTCFGSIAIVLFLHAVSCSQDTSSELSQQSLSEIKNEMLRQHTVRFETESADVTTALAVMQFDLPTVAKVLELNRSQVSEIQKIQTNYSSELKQILGNVPAIDPPNFRRLLNTRTFRELDSESQANVRKLKAGYATDVQNVLMFPQIQMLGKSHLEKGLTTAILSSPVGDLVALNDDQRRKIRHDANRFAAEATEQLLEIRAESKMIFRRELSREQWQKLEEDFGAMAIDGYPDLWQMRPEYLLDVYRLEEPDTVEGVDGPDVVFSDFQIVPGKNMILNDGNEIKLEAAVDVTALSEEVAVDLSILVERKTAGERWTSFTFESLANSQILAKRESRTVKLTAEIKLPPGNYRFTVGAMARKFVLREPEGNAALSDLVRQPFSVQQETDNDKRSTVSQRGQRELPDFFEQMLQLRQHETAQRLANLSAVVPLIDSNLEAAVSALEISTQQLQQLEQIQNPIRDAMQVELGDLPGLKSLDFEKMRRSEAFEDLNAQQKQYVAEQRTEYAKLLSQLFVYSQARQLCDMHLYRGLPRLIVKSPYGKILGLSEFQIERLEKESIEWASKMESLMQRIKRQSVEVVRSNLSEEQWEELQDIYEEELGRYPQDMTVNRILETNTFPELQPMQR